MKQQLSNSDQPLKADIKLIDYWKFAIAQRKIILTCIVICTSIGVIVALVATPVYRAEILLSPVSFKSGNRFGTFANQFGGLASLAGIDLSGVEDRQNEAIAVLLSREFTNAFITDENLMPILYSKVWDKDNKSWKANIDPPTNWDAYKLFNKSIISVNLDKKTKLVTLTIDWIDPVLAAKWANKIVARLNARLRKDAIDESENNLKFLRAQVEKTSIVQIQQSMFGLIETEMKKAMLANVTKEYAFKVIDPAVVPEEKIKPKRRSIVFMSFIIGLIIGLLISIFIVTTKHEKKQSNL